MRDEATSASGADAVMVAEPASAGVIARDDALRGRVLAGFRAGAPQDPEWVDFLTEDSLAALSIWFGARALSAMGHRGTARDTLRFALERDIAVIDRMIASQLDAILHHPRLQALEGRWRGLRWLVADVKQMAERIKDGPVAQVLVRLLNASWQVIARDLRRADDFDQSQLFQKIYETQYGMAGGEPFGLLVVDHAVRHEPRNDYTTDDKATLERLAEIGAASFAPVVIGAAPELLEVESFAELAGVDDPTVPLANPAHARWRAIGTRLDSRFLAVVLPRVLARPPWPDDGTRDEGFRYAESARTAADRVWMMGGYPFASVVARAVAQFGWPADIRGADTDRVGGGLITNLPVEPHQLSQALSLPRLPVEVVFLDRQARKLIEAGLMPITALPHGEDLLFGAIHTLYRPPRQAEPGARAAVADSRVARQINAVLCASRFAHYLKIRGRNAMGTLRRPEDVELELRTWLTSFVNRNTQASAEIRAERPLYDAAVRVFEQPEKPGAYRCAMELQPYFQLDDVTASFRFETEIAPPAT